MHVCGFVDAAERKRAQEGVDGGSDGRGRHAHGGDVRESLHLPEEEAVQMVSGVSYSSSPSLVWLVT